MVVNTFSNFYFITTHRNCLRTKAIYTKIKYSHNKQKAYFYFLAPKLYLTQIDFTQSG